jgi:hypothetical protein
MFSLPTPPSPLAGTAGGAGNSAVPVPMTRMWLLVKPVFPLSKSPLITKFALAAMGTTDANAKSASLVFIRFLSQLLQRKLQNNTNESGDARLLHHQYYTNQRQIPDQRQISYTFQAEIPVQNQNCISGGLKRTCPTMSKV